MEDKSKTIEELTAQLNALRQFVASLKPADESKKPIDTANLAEEANYSAIFNAANDAIFVHDIETGQILDVNNKAAEMYCYPKEEILNLSMHALSAGEKPYTHEDAMGYMNKAAAGEPQVFQWLARDKLDRIFWVEVNLKRAIIGGRYRLLAVVRDINERKQTEQRLEEINRAFLKFTTDPAENISHLTALCGKLLNADYALYNRLEKGILSSCGQWNVPPDFSPADKPDGHICYDVINRGGEEAVIIENLQDTEYANTDPDVAKYGLKTYMGYPVRFGGSCNGSLCVVYQNDYTPSDEDRKIIGILGSAIGIEEERRSESEAVIKRDYQLEILSRTSQHINKILDIPVILRTLVSAGMELVDAKGGSAGLLVNGAIEFNEYNREGHIEPIHYTFQSGYGVAGWVAQTAKPYMANDPEHDSHVVPEIRKALDFYNAIGVPIVGYKGDVLGCLFVNNKKDRLPFETQDVFMLQGLATSAAVALENAENSKRYELVTENIPIHIGAIDKQGKFFVWNKYSNEMLGYTAEEVIGKMSPSAIHESKREAEEVIRIATEEGIYDRELNLVHKDGHLVPAHLVVVPYRSQSGNITGFYGFAEDITRRKELHTELLKSNERLKELALKDPETGLYNHRYLSEVIESEFYRARRYGHALSIIMVDIDYFKSINELYGHDFGDLVLKQFAHYINKLVRKYDIMVRSGGEEFIVLAPGLDRDKALALGRRFLEVVRVYDFGDREHTIKLKMSISVAAYPDDRVTMGKDLINLADGILDKVKDRGGDGVYSSLDIKNGKPKTSEDAASSDIKGLRDKVDKLTRRGKQNLMESIFAFAKTIEIKDHYTGEHAERTVYYATSIARSLGLAAEEVENIRQAAVLHDLGKIGVSDKILHKRSKLTEKEYEEIKRHPQIAADIIRPVQFMHDIVPLVLYHHERWDGKGYPAGLEGADIPMGARIIAIADVYQALTSRRSYRKAYSKNEAMRIIKKGRGSQFDPAVVDALIEILKKEKPILKRKKR
jgi:diguanylate cyclase (GGDEF)-like protein/PAS domain S-box-containing protein